MDIVTLLETFLGPLNNTFGKLIVSTMFLSVFAIGLGLLGISRMFIFLTLLVGILMFTALGWLPIWLIVMIGIGLFVIGYQNIRGGTNV